ncbi:MAG: hypothetical protein RMI04_02890 [Thermofilaceae archaeon]|nr:hypothetical protein [Thermofilaceae archaeon]
MLRSTQSLKSARSLLGKALPLYVINALVPPLLLLYLSRTEVVYTVLVPLVVYSALCIASLLLLLAGRNALNEYSLSSAHSLLRLAGLLGFVSALVAGGVLVTRACKLIAASQEAIKVKKSGG